MSRTKIEFPGQRPYEIWNDNGAVRQSGWFGLPEVLFEFAPTKEGMIQAGAFICGMAKAAQIASGKYTDVKPEFQNEK